MINCSEILDRIKLCYKLEADLDLADFLEIKQSTLSTWRTRNTLNWALVIAKCNICNLDWLLTGDGEMLKSETGGSEENKKTTTISKTGKYSCPNKCEGSLIRESQIQVYRCPVCGRIDLYGDEKIRISWIHINTK